MRQFLNSIFLLIFLTTNSAFAVDWSFGIGGRKEKSNEEVVTFPGKVNLHIEPNGYKFVVSLSTAAEPEKKQFMELDSVKSITQFADQKIALADAQRLVIEKDNRTADLTTWFLVQTANSLVLFFKGSGGIESFTLPLESAPLLHASFATARIKTPQNTYNTALLLSVQDSRGGAKTILIDHASAKTWTISESFQNFNGRFDLDMASQPELNIELSRRTYSLAQIMNRNGVILSRQKAADLGVKNALGAPTAPNGFTNPSAVPEASKSQNGTQAGASQSDSAPDNLNDSSEVNKVITPPTEVNVLIQEGTEKYQIFSSTKEPKGLFVKRMSDGALVQMSVQTHIPDNSSANKGFTIQDGILHHPNLYRKIDLAKTLDGEDAFKIESTFRPEVMTSETSDIKENKEAIDFLLTGFRDFRRLSSKWIKPPEKRDRLIKTLATQLLSGDTVTQVIAGESTDKDLVMAAVARKLPRTWVTVNFDTGGFGDLGVVGEKERKTNLLRTAIRTLPTVLFSNNFISFAGFGTAKGSNTDVLNLMGPDFVDEGGFVKLVATSPSVETIREKIKDPNISSALAITPIADLSVGELKSYLVRMLKTKYPNVAIDEAALDYALNKTSTLRKVSPEPRRTEDFLNAIAKEIKTGSIEIPEIDRAVTYFYGVSENLATERGQLETTRTFLDKVGEVVIGHGHILKTLKDRLEIGLAGLHAPRGAMMMEWLEGPPGVGKTEMAKGLAKAMGVPLGYIDMNNYKPGAATANDLLAAIAKEVSKNPYTAILLDEVEKADPKVLEALLRALSSSEFTYLEDDGTQKIERKQTLYNNPVILTANTIGDVVLEWFNDKIASDPKYESMSSEDLDKEFKQYLEDSKLNIKEMLVQPSAKLPQGLPSPLVDRVRVHVAYPPGFNAMVSIIKFKLKELKERAKMSLSIEFVLSGEGMSEQKVIEEYVKRARLKKLSVRDTLDSFEESVGKTTAQIRYLGSEVYRIQKYYEINPLQQVFKSLNQCQVIYLKK